MSASPRSNQMASENKIAQSRKRENEKERERKRAARKKNASEACHYCW